MAINLKPGNPDVPTPAQQHELRDALSVLSAAEIQAFIDAKLPRSLFADTNKSASASVNPAIGEPGRWYDLGGATLDLSTVTTTASTWNHGDVLYVTNATLDNIEGIVGSHDVGDSFIRLRVIKDATDVSFKLAESGFKSQLEAQGKSIGSLEDYTLTGDETLSDIHMGKFVFLDGNTLAHGTTFGLETAGHITIVNGPGSLVLSDDPSGDPLLLGEDNMALVRRIDTTYESFKFGATEEDLKKAGTAQQVIEIFDDYTIQPYHSSALIRINSVSDVVITIPQTGVNFDNTFNCTFQKIGTGAVEFDTGPTVVVDSDKFRIFSKYDPVSCHVVGVDRWAIYGNLY